MSDDATLIAALKAAGHDQQANALRDKSLANQLREAGHESLASQLDGAVSAHAETDGPATEAEQFVDELKAAATRNTTTVPNFFN